MSDHVPENADQAIERLMLYLEPAQIKWMSSRLKSGLLWSPKERRLPYAGLLPVNSRYDRWAQIHDRHRDPRICAKALMNDIDESLQRVSNIREIIAIFDTVKSFFPESWDVAPEEWRLRGV